MTEGFGPKVAGFDHFEFGNHQSLKKKITKNMRANTTREPTRTLGPSATPSNFFTPLVAHAKPRIVSRSNEATMNPTAAPAPYRFNAVGDESINAKMTISATLAVSAGTSMNPKKLTRPRYPLA